MVVPEDATADEWEAARLIMDTLAHAAQRSRSRFTVTREGPFSGFRRAIYVGETRRSRSAPAFFSSSNLVRPVFYAIERRAIVVRAAHRADAVFAASWFLETALGARWFTPGEIGAEVEPRRALALPNAFRAAAPGYYSRELMGIDKTAEGRAWSHRNRLHRLLAHGHTLAQLAPLALLAQRPEFAPLLNGAKFIPLTDAVLNWQPDILEPGFASFIAERVMADLRAHPAKVAVAVAQNDTYRWDQSARTLAAIEPKKFFRGRPDYSDVLFPFVNAVAERVGRDFPDRFITTYAYDWTENVPRAPVARNVIPFLTADRSMWCDPDFAAGDRDLMARWHRAGPAFLGLYDYLEGGPFLVPRPTLWALTEPIPYGYRNGARAYVGELMANWGLDGPKPWLAAQLLWNPNADSDALLDEYFKRYWREAGNAMRTFFAVCDEQWRNQPRPVVWMKYLKDDDQRRLFPPVVRAELHAALRSAATLARTPVVARRVEMAKAAFEVTEAFCRHDELREELQRLAFAPAATTEDLARAIEAYSAARAELIECFQRVRASSPHAIHTAALDDYLRGDPRRRVIAELARRGESRRVAPAIARSLFETDNLASLEKGQAGGEILTDTQWRTLSVKPVHPFTLTDWVERGPWGGKSEPTERRKIELTATSDGTQRLRYEGINQESLWQWQRAQPAHFYRARVRIRGVVQPGTMVYLLAPLLDQQERHIGSGHFDRLPVGNWPDWVTLEVVLRAPRNAGLLGFGLRTLYQVPGEWVEWESPSLVDLGP